MTEETKHHETHTQHTSHPSHTSHSSPLKDLPPIPKVDLKGVTPDALKGGLMDVVEILKLNKTKIDAVAGRDSEGVTMALIYLAIGSFGAPLGGAIFGYNVLGVTFRTPILNALIGGVIATVMGALVVYITSLVAERLFKGKGKFPQFFRVMGYAYLVSLLGIVTMVPFLGSLAGIWVLVVDFIALQQVHKLDTTNAILTIIVTIVAFVVLSFLVASLGMSAMMGGLGGSGVSLNY